MHFYVKKRHMRFMKKQRIFVMEMSLQEHVIVIKYNYP